VLYFDTSFLTPLILEEATSNAVERFIRRQTVGDLAISQWTRTEFSSLLAREVRMGGLAPKAALAADAQFETLIAESFVILLPTADDFALSKRYLQNYASGLRAGDALHLAIAANNNARAIHTFDKTMAKAGKQIGLPMAAGTRARTA
jgi:predicted nucleic acid-binding protein